jgi:hypothetical protein
MPTAYSPGPQRLSELPGFTLVQGPCVVPGGFAVIGRLSCALTTELDTIVRMSKAASFVCSFTLAPSTFRYAYERDFLASFYNQMIEAF